MVRSVPKETPSHAVKSSKVETTNAVGTAGKIEKKNTVLTNTVPTISSDHPLASLLAERLLLAEKTESTLDLLNDMQLYRPENHQVRAIFTSTRLCTNIVETMKQHRTYLDVIYKCCQLVISLTFDHEMNTVAFTNADGANCVVDAMKNFRHSVKIQISGCGTLRNLLYHIPDESILGIEGLKAIVYAMNKYPNDTNLLEKACGCLYNLLLCQEGKVRQYFDDTCVGALLASIHSRFVQRNDHVADAALKVLTVLYANSDDEDEL